MSTDVFLVSDRQVIHRAVITDDGGLLTSEADNADDMKGYEVRSEIPEWAEGHHFCRRCFPPGPDSDPVAA
jgi:hypothetical protein